MALDIIKFVDRIAGSPSVRLDLNDGVLWGVNYNGTDLSPPPLKSAWASTLLSDGERLSAAAYANRQIQLNIDLMSSNPDTIATELQKLWRELNRPSNFIMYQPIGVSRPVFFRTIRSSNTRVTELPAGTMHNIQVTIDAEPFAYGLMETVTAVTVIADPTTSSGQGGARQMNFNVANPKGDVETPLFLKVNGSAVLNTAANGPKTSLIATRRRGSNVEDVPWYLGAEQMSINGFILPRRLSTFSGYQNALNANSDFETDASNWTVTGGTFTRDTSVAFAGSASGKLTPSGSAGTVTLESEKVPVTPGVRYVASAQVRPAVTRTVEIAVCYYNSSNALIGTPVSSAVGLNSGSFTLIDASGLAPGSAVTATIRIQMIGTPPASNIINIDAAELGVASVMRVDTSTLTSYTTVLNAVHPSFSSVDARGTYRVYMRYAYGGAGTTATSWARLRWGDQQGGNLITNPEVNLPHNGTDCKMVDLGLIQIPGGYDPVQDGLSGVELAAKAIYLALQIKDGTSIQLDLDYLFLAPADDRLTLIRWPTSPSPPVTMTIDSAAGQVHGLSASNTIETAAGAQVAGAYPLVTPGITNKIFFVNDIGTEQTVNASRTQTTTITPYYWPRYLRVSPPTS